ncbi:MAG TPA: hopanoid C-3 methylase HpnR [Candidatus Tectomicrobia bacterium]|nr:hopanoid C-3 methylase HpnR [Candidatus Tectomicrobia bacterium]
MRVLLVHPSPLMYSEIFLRLEPIGLERVAQAVRAAGHEVRLLDLQVFDHAEYVRQLAEFQPHAVGFSLNYLANVPEVVDLARATRLCRPDTFVFAGGHSGSFVADELLEHADGALDAVVRGEGETITPRLLEAARDPRLHTLPGVVTRDGAGPAPTMLDDLDRFPPARDLARRRDKYFIGVLDPCASAELTRGCPWDCSFCSAWTFYARAYRKASPEAAAEDLARIAEPNVFLVDDVAFIHPEHGFAIGQALERRGVKKAYYLETRCDVLVRNRDVFAYWKRLGLHYMFLGVEALDEASLRLHRKRVTPSTNAEALELARRLGITVAVNIIVDPDWDEGRFAAVREWAAAVPEIVHLTVATPYPGTEIWHTESRRLTSLDYRLFDVQHAVLPTRLPLREFYRELVATQAVLNRKHLGAAALWKTAAIAARLALRGQTNFLRMLWRFGRVYDAERQYADHQRPVTYAMRPPARRTSRPTARDLFVHVASRAEDRAAG